MNKLWGWLTGGAVSPDKVLDNVTAGLDALVYTKEEKARMALQAGEQWLELQRVIAHESSPRSVNRRVVAWAVVLEVVLVVNVCVGCILVGRSELVDHIVRVAEGFKLGLAFLAVITFYFGPHLVQKLKGGAQQ